MNYQQELEKLQEGSQYWKPKAGQFRVVALSELEEAEPFVKKHEDKDDEVTPQFKIKISVSTPESKPVETIWKVGKGFTSASSYGQLLDLGAKNDGKLTGVKFSVVVKNDGTKNDYTIVA